MVTRLSSKRRTSRAMRIAAFMVCGITIWHYHRTPAFTVKGSWAGTASDITSLPKGLGPESVDGIAVGESGLTVAVAGGHLAMDWSSGGLTVKADDTKKWSATYGVPDTSLSASGSGGSDINWALAKHGHVAGLGTVDVNVTSDKKNPFAVVVVPELPSLKDTDLGIKAISHGKEIQATLNLARQLTRGVDFTYTLQNEEGKYDFDRFMHNVQVSAQLDRDSQALLSLVGDMKQQTYNASITTDLSSQLSSKKHDADAVLTVGFDNGGLYGSFQGSRQVGQGFTASYDVAGRVPSKKSAKKHVQEKITMTNNIVTATLTQATGEQTAASVAFDVNEGPLNAQGSITQVIGNKLMPTYKITLTRGLADVLGPGAEAQLTLDDLSLDGLSGRLTWKHDLKKMGATIEYESKGPLKSLEHQLKVANALGYVLLTKQEKGDPRITIGYQWEV